MMMMIRLSSDIVPVHHTLPLEYAVGSDVTLQCRLRDPSSHNVSKMIMKKGNRFLDVSVAGDGVIETTLHNVTLMNDVIECLEGSTFLAMQTLCVGGECALPCLHTASLAKWLRRPPRERKMGGWGGGWGMFFKFLFVCLFVCLFFVLFFLWKICNANVL